MAISYSDFGSEKFGSTPVLTTLFGEKAAVNQNSILLKDQDSEASEQGDALELNPHERTELQKLIAIFHEDGPQTAFDTAIRKVLNGDIDMELAYQLVDKIYEEGYRKEALEFGEQLNLLSIDPVIADLENKKREEARERLDEEGRRLQIENIDPTDPDSPYYDPTKDPQNAQFRFG